jgi:hypothetical protein
MPPVSAHWPVIPDSPPSGSKFKNEQEELGEIGQTHAGRPHPVDGIACEGPRGNLNELDSDTPTESSRLKSAAHKAHLMVARHMALLVLNADCCLASQHLQGDLNTAADLLSFLGGITRAGGKKHPIAFDDPPDDILTQRFHLCHPGQIPENFKMSPLPTDISSWVLSILQNAASSLTAELKKATNQKTKPGDAGPASAPKPEEAMTLSSISCPQTDKSFLCGSSLPAFERPDGRREAELLKASVKSRCAQSHRPLGYDVQGQSQTKSPPH